MPRQIHEFDNGVKIFDDHLTQFQRDRYAKRNVHEAEEEDIFLRLMSVVPANGCFLNIGAAAGYYSILAKKMLPALSVHAVEPLEEHRRFFRENVRLNGFSLKDFTLHPEAISSLNGNDTLLDQDYGSALLRENEKAVPFIQNAFQSIWTRIFPKSPQPGEKRKFRVRTMTLDCLIRVIGKPVDLLLLDVQGLEADVLRGCTSSFHTGKIKALLIGTHGQEVHEECLTILKTQGFDVKYENPTPKDQPDGIIAASSIDPKPRNLSLESV